MPNGEIGKREPSPKATSRRAGSARQGAARLNQMEKAWAYPVVAMDGSISATRHALVLRCRQDVKLAWPGGRAATMNRDDAPHLLCVRRDPSAV
jgi:hypothetical protein